MGKEGKNIEAEVEPVVVEVVFKPVEALEENLRLLVNSVNQKDETLLKRVFRKTTAVRKGISVQNLEDVICKWLPDGNVSRSQMITDLSLIPRNDMEVESSATSKVKETTVTPEVEAYLHLFTVQLLLQSKKYKESLSSVSLLLENCAKSNRRTLDIFQAKGYHYKSRTLELMGKLKDIRNELMGAHRTACLRLDEYGQAALINLILRNFLQQNLIEQASKFAAKATFPDSVSNNQQLRYLYYMGRIHAIQLDYSLAYRNLTQAIRKSPANTGLGYRITIHKLASIVQLLMGETPERVWFSQPELHQPLKPYFELVKAVRNGSLAEYDHIRKQYAADFEKDSVLTLVVRLRNSVIRTGLRRINVSYSRISFKDIANKLALESLDTAELACAKAIRDGVIDAKIDHDAKLLQSNESMDIYATIEPQQAFHRRIQFCLTIHNDAMKAMRYPPDAHKAKLKVEEKGKTDEEIAKEIEHELEEDEV